MAESLLIRLGSQDNERIHWLISSADNQEIIGSGELASAEQLTELTEKAQSRKVIVLVPACDVALKALKVPGKSQRAIKLATPYMLEDELAQEVEQLFFAYSKVAHDEHDNNCFVAAIEHEQMQVWLQWLKDAEIKATHMLPDALAMPLIENAYSVIQLGQQMVVRLANWQAMTLDLATWQVVSQQWQTEQQITLANYSAIDQDELQVELSPQPEELPLALFAQQVANCPINLLQGQYQQTEKRLTSFVHWRLAASLLAVALFINLTNKVVQLTHLSDQQAAIESEIVATYKEAFPAAKNVKVAKVKSLVKYQLQKVGGDNSEESFIRLLNVIQPAFVVVNNLKPSTLKFDQKRNEIRLQVTAPSYQALESFKSELEKSELTVSIGSQNNQGNQVTGSFSIKESS